MNTMQSERVFMGKKMTKKQKEQNKKDWHLLIIVAAAALIPLYLLIAITPKIPKIDPSTQSNSTIEKAKPDIDKINTDLGYDLSIAYSNLAKVDYHDTSWEINNQKNPETFPYKYRDILFYSTNRLFEKKYFVIEVRVINAEHLEYFQNHYTCEEMTGGPNCIVETVGNRVLFSIIYDPEYCIETCPTETAKNLRENIEKILIEKYGSIFL